MLLVKAMHAPEFLTAHHLGVEIHITRDDVKENFAQYIPFIGGIHLPYPQRTREDNSEIEDDKSPVSFICLLIQVRCQGCCH